MSYSNASGGTLTLPSPTHVHHVDVGSAVRSLRRSLSRSPSKFKLTGRASPTPDSSNARHSPTPPSGRFEIPPTSTAGSDQEQPTAISLFSTPQPTGATPFKPTVKLSVRSLRSKPVTRPLSRTRVSPKSPLKRVFGPSPDSGNPLPSSASAPEPRGQENHSFRDFALGLSPVSRRSPQKPTRHSMHLDVSGSSKNGLSKFIDANTEPFPAISISPLKRSDANMSVDQTNLGSPVAKRRSLHGISSLDTDFSNIFDPPATTPQPFDIHEDSNQEYQLTNTPPGSPFRESAATPTPSAMPKRASSLRRSTLQQRHGDTRISSFGRRAGEKQLAQLSNEAVTPLFRSRPRLSLDQYLPPDERGSPFSPQAPLPNPSIHPIPRAANQPHPLSRTITQSSSNSSLPDDSPTHLPVHFGERPRVPINFSKSLPVGSRPPAHDSESVATPEYKRAKPFQAAFMSTGLVSKMNRNPELGPPKHPGAKITTMPDTPCKKQPYNSATYPPNLGSGGRSGGRRRSRPSFGSPSTPFGSVTGQAGGSTFGNMDKPGSLFFQQIRAGHTRKSSLLALDDEQGDSADMGDDFPPTPTKNLFFRSISTPQGAQTPPSSRTYALPNSTFKSGTEPSPLESGSKSLTPQDALSNGGREEGDQPVKATIHPFTPNVGGSPRMSRSLPCFALRRSRGDLFATPAPVKTIPTLSSFDDTEMDEEGQTDPEVSASPLNVAEYVESTTPRTPQDSMDAMAPPDPSRLSISNSQDDNGRFARPPATPTTHARQLFPSFAERRASLSFTPQNGHGPKDVDESLSIRFDKSEIIGRGEFSQVFRVSNYSSSSYVSAFSTTPSRRTPPGPESEQVYAVKRIRIGSTGTRERELKLREVAILKALSNSDRVVRYFDSWEQSGYLYIQTEYCTEGSLDNFLKEVGQTGRLDDFRIWKIMVEASQGLAAIHDAGFIHLDIKPANIFIGFDGYLKIGDFGMAAQWPAEKGIEGEGDREYIGPEILLGQYDKPADIFALGLIILEIACNVFLPDNGPTWQALRNGDLSTVPSLTSADASTVIRDANGIPVEQESAGGDVGMEMDLHGADERQDFPFETMTHDPSNLFGTPRRSELQDPPTFMADASDPNSLDNIVRWMIQPNPVDRPTAHQILDSEPVFWVLSRRAAGATVYEGNWGPLVEELEEEPVELLDTEMMDV